MIQRSMLKGMLNLVDVQTSALMTAPARKDFVQERHLPMLYMPSVSITRLTVSDATQGVRSLLTCLVKNLVSSLHKLNYSITNSKVYSTSFVTLIYRESGLFLLHCIIKLINDSREFYHCTFDTMLKQHYVVDSFRCCSRLVAYCLTFAW